MIKDIIEWLQRLLISMSIVLVFILLDIFMPDSFYNKVISNMRIFKMMAYCLYISVFLSVAISLRNIRKENYEKHS